MLPDETFLIFTRVILIFIDIGFHSHIFYSNSVEQSYPNDLRYTLCMFEFFGILWYVINIQNDDIFI